MEMNVQAAKKDKFLKMKLAMNSLEFVSLDE